MRRRTLLHVAALWYGRRLSEAAGMLLVRCPVAHSESIRWRVYSLRWPTESEGGYFHDCQPCLDAVINEAQSSGGFPRVSILAKTVYGSVLLPTERSVDRSLTHA